jgi:hypothetical protein
MIKRLFFVIYFVSITLWSMDEVSPKVQAVRNAGSLERHLLMEWNPCGNQQDRLSKENLDFIMNKLDLERSLNRRRHGRLLREKQEEERQKEQEKEQERMREKREWDQMVTWAYLNAFASASVPLSFAAEIEYVFDNRVVAKGLGLAAGVLLASTFASNMLIRKHKYGNRLFEGRESLAGLVFASVFSPFAYSTVLSNTMFERSYPINLLGLRLASPILLGSTTYRLYSVYKGGGDTMGKFFFAMASLFSSYYMLRESVAVVDLVSCKKWNTWKDCIILSYLAELYSYGYKAAIDRHRSLFAEWVVQGCYRSIHREALLHEALLHPLRV